MEIRIHKDGDPLLLEDAPGCFLCGIKPEPYVMNFCYIDEKRPAPVFFVCPLCKLHDNCELRCFAKFMKLQKEALRGQSRTTRKAQ